MNTKVLEQGLIWFIRLRWVAGGAIVFFSLMLWEQTALTARILTVGAGIFTYNAVFLFTEKRKVWNRRVFAHAQILLDWFALGMLSQFTGGAASPLIPFFLFHVMIGSILLEPAESFLHTTFAVGLVSFLGVFNASPAQVPWEERNFILLGRTIPVAWLVMVFVFYTTAYLSGFVARMLKRRELDLEALNLKLEKENEERVRFLLRTAHSLKSPLSTATSLIHSFLFSRGSEIQEPSREVFVKVQDKMIHLSKMVQDLLYLAYARTATLKDKKTAVDMVSTWQKTEEKLIHKINEKGITVHADYPPAPLMLQGDPEEWARVFENLLDNAVKYCPVGSSIAVSLSEAGDMIQYCIRDPGIGIPPEDISRIAEEFFRAKNARCYTEEGTGLGLSIVKNTVEKYKGQLRLDSVPGKGTSITILIPREGIAHA